jgi:hypothetical protein
MGAALGTIVAILVCASGPIGWGSFAVLTLGGGAGGALATKMTDDGAAADEADKFVAKVLADCAKASPNGYADFKSQFNHQVPQINRETRGRVPITVMVYDQRQAVANQLGISIDLAGMVFK